MEMREKVRKMVAEAEVPAEMTAALEAMSDEEFWAEAERVEESLDEKDYDEQKRLYAIAVIREQLRRGALNEKRKKDLEEEVAARRSEIEEKQKLIAGLERVRDDLQLRVDELSRTAKRPGRNEPCPCGSGKKYKHCCGRV